MTHLPEFEKLIVNGKGEPLDLSGMPKIITVKVIDEHRCTVTFDGELTPNQVGRVRSQHFVEDYHGNFVYDFYWIDPYAEEKRQAQAILHANLATIEARKAAGERVLFHVFSYDAEERASAGMDGYCGAYTSLDLAKAGINRSYSDADIAVIDGRTGALVCLLYGYGKYRNSEWKWHPPDQPEILT